MGEPSPRIARPWVEWFNSSCLAQGFLPMADLELAAGQRSRDAAAVLQWAGIALLGMFLAQVVASAWPIALLQPAWLERMGEALQNLGVNSLVGAVLLVLARLLDQKHDTLERRVRLVRRLASWAALGFLLLIPLQAFTGVRLLGDRTRQENSELARIEQATKAIEAATTEAELRAAIGRFPGAPLNLPASLNQPFAELRDRLSDQLRPRLKQAEASLAEARAGRWQAWLRKWLRGGVLSLFLALGFAAIGQPGPDRPTLLTTLFGRRAGALWKPLESNAGKVPANPAKPEDKPRKPSWLMKPPSRDLPKLPWETWWLGKKRTNTVVPRGWLPEKPKREPGSRTKKDDGN
jgi:hypothetical protein